MSNKIKVWNTNSSAKPNNAIKVFEYGSTATKPNDAILVTSADNGPANAIKVNVVNDYAADAIPVWYAGGGETPFPYETVKIGDNVWMAENLKYTDESISSEGNVKTSACVLNGVDFGTQYFYDRTGIMKISANFPGWHIPTQYDVELLINEVAGDCDSLRTTGGWVSGMNGNDLKKFHAEPLVVFGAPPYHEGRRFIFPFMNNNINQLNTCGLSADNRITSGHISNATYYTVRLVKDNL